jgi:hypothetical protein
VLSFTPSSEAGVQIRQWFKSPGYCVSVVRYRLHLRTVLKGSRQVGVHPMDLEILLRPDDDPLRGSKHVARINYVIDIVISIVMCSTDLPYPNYVYYM